MNSSGSRVWVFMLTAGALVIVLGLPSPCAAANHYVGCGATGAGTGANWTNAFTDLPSSLIRSDTYVVAGSTSCTYSYHLFRDSGTATITIRKAQASLDSGVAGWQASFETAQAVWQIPSNQIRAWQFSTGNYVFDGITGSGVTGFGFKLLLDRDAEFITMGVGGSDICNNLTFKHFEIDNSPNTATTLKSTGFFNVGCSVSNILIQDCYIHDIPGTPFQANGWSSATIDHCFVARNKSSAAVHSEGLSDNGGTNFIISNNVWLDIIGTGVLVSRGIGTNWQVFGNVFILSGQQFDGLGEGNGVITTLGATSSGLVNLKVYNNTFINMSSGGGNPDVRFVSAFTNSGDIQNNLWFNSGTVSMPTEATHGFNSVLNSSVSFTLAQNEINVISGASDPFVNAAGPSDAALNFRLKAQTDAGNALGPAFSPDPRGLARGADGGTWSRGAFQFARPNPPLNLR